jgi:hypothetical protein
MQIAWLSDETDVIGKTLFWKRNRFSLKKKRDKESQADSYHLFG